MLSLTGWTAQVQPPQLPYVIVGTGQTQCYDNRHEIALPKVGQPFCGQDAQSPGRAASYTISADGLTVYDNNTALTWQRSPNLSGGTPTSSDKLTFKQAEALPSKLNAETFGGFSDWRVPTIKELYSLINFNGTDPSGPNVNASRLKPFIDTRYFKFVYGDPNSHERIIDSQWATSTLYTGQSVRGQGKMFGVNFADGRIKGYDLLMPRGNMQKTFYVICVRGNPRYGHNDFYDNGDGTITDRATGLMWSKGDSGKGMNWQAALAWVQAKNAEKFLGHNDWRLPNAKELQSIVDYARCPDATGSPAIDPLLKCTAITNEVGAVDYGFYWSSTTHAGLMGGNAAVYVAFGRAGGWLSGIPGQGAPGGGDFGRPPPDGPPPDGPGGPPDFGGPDSGSANYHYTDVHGAGAQRSDPKAGDARNFPHGRGPQGDVIRIDNFVRLVRDARNEQR